MNKQTVLDLYFPEARSRLLDLAAFLDRVERAEGEEDFRVRALRAGLREIAVPAADHPDHSRPRQGHVRRVLTLLSDPTTEPLPTAETKAAAGAWPGFGQEVLPPSPGSPADMHNAGN